MFVPSLMALTTEKLVPGPDRSFTVPLDALGIVTLYVATEAVGAGIVGTDVH
jgi:hypothetical protein